MATFTGTDANESITPGSVSATVTVDPPGSVPSAEIDVINAGGGNDVAAGGGGDDLVDMGIGDDRYFWREGDGRDLLAGGVGNDQLTFEATAGDNFIFMSDEGGDSRSLSTAAATSGVDFSSVESVTINALEGGDQITLYAGATQGVPFVYINLAPTPSEIVADAGQDILFFHGGGLDDVMAIGGGSTASISGLGSGTVLADFGGANDRVQMHGGLGGDRISAADYSGPMGISLHGNGGDDSLIGSSGNDVLFGDDGDDFVEGRAGNDNAALGEGSDRYSWGVADGEDWFDGGAGFDRAIVTGTGTTTAP